MTTTYTQLFETQLPEILAELKTYVEMETPTHDKAAVDKLGDYIAAQFRALGGSVEVIARDHVGNPLRISFGDGPEQILILGHFDTVKPLGTLAQEPWRIEEGKAYGPGVFDMKAGIVFCYFALRALLATDVPLRKRITLLWNTDEEIGSHASRDLIRTDAAVSTAVLVLEPGLGQCVKTSRKSGGEFSVKTYGKAAHAGNDYTVGVNAIVELAHHILTIQSWTNLDTGTTLAVDVVRGGTATNVIADYAEAQVDVRVATIAEAQAITERLHSLRPVLPGARVEVSGGIDKIPLERTAGTARLFDLARIQALDEGFTLCEASVGGTSDGNVAAETGADILDGLGAVGDGAHASHEHVVIADIPRRIALLTRLLETL